MRYLYSLAMRVEHVFIIQILNHNYRLSKSISSATRSYNAKFKRHAIVTGQACDKAGAHDAFASAKNPRPQTQ